MARNTNIEALLFPVKENSVCLAGQKYPISGFKAITGDFGKYEKVFSIVSSDYKLVTNEDALKMGKEIHSKLFPNAIPDSFELFNIRAPQTGASCQIDFIDKNYKFSIGVNEDYFAFVRIHNSYNRTRALQFDIGFCRSICTNGVIYEKDSVQFKYAHTSVSMGQLDLGTINVAHLKKLEQKFISITKKSQDIIIEKRYFVALAAKVMARQFNLTTTDTKKLQNEKIKLEKFTNSIKRFSETYTPEMGETAYAFYNVITDYASNDRDVNASAINGLQTKCGNWINGVGELVAKPGFNWEQELEDYKYLLN